MSLSLNFQTVAFVSHNALFRFGSCDGASVATVLLYVSLRLAARNRDVHDVRMMTRDWRHSLEFPRADAGAPRLSPTPPTHANRVIPVKVCRGFRRYRQQQRRRLPVAPSRSRCRLQAPKSTYAALRPPCGYRHARSPSTVPGAALLPPGDPAAELPTSHSASSTPCHTNYDQLTTTKLS
eukprot:scaffold5321_cov366-Prasinococcus_capsulatus_cf.AAC.5